MKILHTADWHLGKRLDAVERLPEQQEVLAEICEIADKEKVDVIVVAGDLFDTGNPGNQAEKLYYKTLKRLTAGGKRPVIAIAGNHDSPQRIENPVPLAEECGILFSGYPDTLIEPFTLETGVKITRSAPGFAEIQLPQFAHPLRVILTPYANEFRMRKFLGTEDREEELRKILSERWQALADEYCDDKGVNILTTHLFVMQKNSKPQAEPESEKPILHVGGAQAIYTENFPSQMQYVALGHLHRKQIVSDTPCPIAYSSSILAYSFAEAGQSKYVLIADIEPGAEAKVKEVKLSKGKPLLRARFEDIDEAVSWLGENQNALVEITIVSDDFLQAQDRKRLHDAHEFIVTLIPEVKNPTSLGADQQAVDLNRSVSELFADYFQSKHGTSPGEEIMDLFKEMLSES